jgi:hypothetical protein
MIYVVLGMARSGTTVLAETLHHSGIDMGEEIDPSVPYDAKNDYERLATKAISQEILLGDRWRSSLNMPRPDRLVITPDQALRMSAIVEGLSSRGVDWGFKYPRTVFLYPEWAEVLGPHRVIAIYRDWREMWPRYRKKRVRHHPANLLRAGRFVRRWVEYGSAIAEILESLPGDRWALFRFDELMRSPAELDLLASFVGRPIVDRRRQDLYRNRPARYPWVEILRRAADLRRGASCRAVEGRLEGLRGRFRERLAERRA